MFGKGFVALRGSQKSNCFSALSNLTPFCLNDHYLYVKDDFEGDYLLTIEGAVNNSLSTEGCLRVDGYLKNNCVIDDDGFDMTGTWLMEMVATVAS